jgi:hypothetical protein
MSIIFIFIKVSLSANQNSYTDGYTGWFAWSLSTLNTIAYGINSGQLTGTTLQFQDVLKRSKIPVLKGLQPKRLA